MISAGYRWPLYSDDDTAPIKRSLPDDLPGAHPTTPNNLTALPAQWTGRGCFNHGVYRFELLAPADVTLAVDGDEVCLYVSGDDSCRVGYACLETDRVVTVAFAAYTCDTEFDLDVYQIR